MVITPWFGLKLARGEYEYIPLGVFEIKKAKVNAKGVTVTAYDNMNKFSRSCTITNTSGQPYDMLLFACKACDVELGNSREEIEALANGTRHLFFKAWEILRLAGLYILAGAMPWRVLHYGQIRQINMRVIWFRYCGYA